jgi:hypothetical protein
MATVVADDLPRFVEIDGPDAQPRDGVLGRHATVFEDFGVEAMLRALTWTPMTAMPRGQGGSQVLQPTLEGHGRFSLTKVGLQ